MKMYVYHVGFVAKHYTVEGGYYQEHGDETVTSTVPFTDGNAIAGLRAELVRVHATPAEEGIQVTGPPTVIISGIFLMHTTE